MKRALSWLAVTLGMGAIWFVTRAVVAYFFGILAFFVTAFEASVVELTKVSERIEERSRAAQRVPRRLASDRAMRKDLAPQLIDLRDEETIRL